MALDTAAWEQAMKTGDACTRTAFLIDEHDSALAAAQLMRELRASELVIMRLRDDGANVPVGTVSDRELALAVTARKIDAEEVAVGELFASGPPFTVTVDEPLDTALTGMRARGLARAPVVNADGTLVGILSSN